MPKREKVPADRSASAGQVGNIIARIAPRLDYTSDEADAITNNKQVGARFDREITAVLAKFKFTVSVPGFGADLARWVKTYEKYFGKTPDFSNLVVPAKPENVGPMRLIVVAREIVDWTGGHPLQGTMNALKRIFATWQYIDDLDVAIPQSDRDPRTGSYALWVRDVREADAENANLSANDLARRGGQGSITVLERMLLEADYFEERGEHMDQENWTLCAGSRNRDGGVPYGSWSDPQFRVDWYNASNRNPNLRSRSVYL